MTTNAGAKLSWLDTMPPEELDAMADRLTTLLATDHQMSEIDGANCRQLLDMVINEKASRIAHAR